MFLLPEPFWEDIFNKFLETGIVFLLVLDVRLQMSRVYEVANLTAFEFIMVWPFSSNCIRIEMGMLGVVSDSVLLSLVIDLGV